MKPALEYSDLPEEFRRRLGTDATIQALLAAGLPVTEEAYLAQQGMAPGYVDPELEQAARVAVQAYREFQAAPSTKDPLALSPSTV